MGVGLAMKLKAIPGGQGGAVTSGVESYEFSPEFECALTRLICGNREVYSRIGTHLNPKSMSSKQAAMLLKAAQAIADDMGEGPSATLTVIQRLKAWREAGQVTHEQILEAGAYLDAAEDAGLPDAEAVIKETARVLKKRAKKENAKKVLDAMAKDGDFAKLGAELAAVERIGQSRMTLGETLHDDIFAQIVEDNAASRFPTGCLELDHVCGGGLPQGYTLFLGREKSGKSMVLSSIAADAIFRGKNVAIATLELSVLKQIERVTANMLGLPLHVVQTNKRASLARYEQIKPQLGKFSAVKFAPDTPVAEITRWVERLAEEWGQKVDLLVVDYADLVGAGKVGKDSNDYKDAKVVGNHLRDHAVQNGYVCISATQGRRSSGTSGRPLDMDDVADSQHKVRIADLVVAMRMEPDQKDMVDWFVILNRDGNDRNGTGMLPTYREMGRMFPINRYEPWE